MLYAVLVYKPYYVHIPKFYGVFSTEKSANKFGLDRASQFDEKFDVVPLLPIDSDVEVQKEAKEIQTEQESPVVTKTAKSFLGRIVKRIKVK